MQEERSLAEDMPEASRPLLHAMNSTAETNEVTATRPEVARKQRGSIWKNCRRWWHRTLASLPSLSSRTPTKYGYRRYWLAP